MTVAIQSLTKRFGGVHAIDDLTVQFRPNAITVLLGASGCGKTTTLRCIAGLEQPTSGEMEIDGRTVYSSTRNIDLPPEKRELGMVFQSYAIWPHLSVMENVALPLRARGTAHAAIDTRVRDTLASVGLGQQVDRSAMQLSGGQQQRVSIARCLVADPRLILMDEPLSNLDAKLRVEMRHEIRNLQRRIGATILFVTHDQEEAMSLADEIFLFDRGRIVQRGAPEELYFRPAVRYVAEFLGKANLFPVALRSHAGETEVVAQSGQIVVKGDVTGAANGNEALCMVRPEAWRVQARSHTGVPGRVRESSFVGDRRELRVETPLGDQTVVTPGFERYANGDEITLSVAPQHLHLMRGELQ
ncbi:MULTISPECIES: ABC transporter ATP-binding protein [unclassified Caballeronia]|uniref:ABC transporter ATP-binding protein n=1 Tax=unclassified Caballeronia TaxID=2646786 RepID=UPI0028587B69|nr:MULTISPECIES: ABC transporter ATP-binding protein [unclassified Caballeronia]MDR5770901.1 ABC transporter ATP-binding protein [Caballeronia sp. LZ002]MDR5846338.1 ABC transporter ATP-binding protein [Caballeronia sp. LZ003]